MKVTPRTEQEIAEDGLFPAGIYDFEVVKAEDTISKKGNDMVALTLKVFSADDRTTLVNDWLLDAIAYKVRHFAATVGMLPAYESGDMQADAMLHRAGRVKLKVEPAKDNYPAKNTVADYVVAEGAASRVAAPARAKVAAPSGADDPFDDEVPF